MKKNWRLFIAAFSLRHNSPIAKTEKIHDAHPSFITGTQVIRFKIAGPDSDGTAWI
jgi:hypothetical protein